MSWNNIQAKVDQGFGSTTGTPAKYTISFASPVSAGSVVRGFFIAENDQPANLTSITNDKGDACTFVDFDEDASNGEGVQAFVCVAPTAGAQSFIATFDAPTAFIGGCLLESTFGAGFTYSLDGHNHNFQAAPSTGANSINSNSTTTAANGDLITGFAVGTGGSPVYTSGTSPNSFTQRININDPIGGTYSILAEDFIQAAAGSIAATIGLTSFTGTSANTVSFVITIKAVASGINLALAATETPDTAAFTVTDPAPAVATQGRVGRLFSPGMNPLERFRPLLAFPPSAPNVALVLNATEGVDVAAFTTTFADQFSLAVTEAADVAAFTTTFSDQLALATTEIADTAAFTATFADQLSLAATEAADVAAFNLGGVITLALAVTEAPDVAAFSCAFADLFSFAVTEAADVAAFVGDDPTALALAATEGADIAAFTATFADQLALAATEGADTAAFTVTFADQLALAATETPDAAAFAVDFAGAPVFTLAATEGVDTAAFALGVVNPALAGGDGGKSKKYKKPAHPDWPIEGLRGIVPLVSNPVDMLSEAERYRQNQEAKRASLRPKEAKAALLSSASTVALAVVPAARPASPAALAKVAAALAPAPLDPPPPPPVTANPALAAESLAVEAKRLEEEEEEEALIEALLLVA